MADILDQRIAELQRTQRLQRCFNAWAPAFMLSLFIGALLVMLLRLSVSNSAWIELPILALAALIPFIVIPQKWRIQIPRQDLAAEVDLICEGRGLCMALSSNEQSDRDPDWMARLRRSLDDMRMPPFQWHAAKYLPLVCICLLLALLMPRAEINTEFTQRFAPFFDDLIADLEQLEENDVIDQEIKEEKHKELEQLKAKAQEEGMNQEIWLARDAIKSYMDQQKKLAGQRLAEAVVAAEQLKQEQTKAQQQKLMQALANLADQNKDLLQKLDPQQAIKMAAMMQQMGNKMKFTPEQLAALEAHMKRNGLDMQKMAALQELGQDNGLPKMDKQQQQQFAQDLLDKLNKQCDTMGQMGMNVDGLLVRMRQSGGINRGPGHVQLTEKDPTNINTGDAEALMAGARMNADGSITLAESVRKADINDEALKEAVRAAAQQFDPTAADARRSNTAPRHRSTIARYFSSQTHEDIQPNTSDDQTNPEKIDVIEVESPPEKPIETTAPVEEGDIDFP